MASTAMPTGWAFSRCVSCLGFALVRQGAKNIIKVNSAPADEKVLIPDLFTAPSQNTQVSALLQADGSIAMIANAAQTTAKPTIKPAQRKKIEPQTREAYAREAAHFAQMAAATEKQADLKQANAATLAAAARALSGKTVPFPSPLPEPPLRNDDTPLAPFMTGLAAAIILATAFLHFV